MDKNTKRLMGSVTSNFKKLLKGGVKYVVEEKKEKKIVIVVRSKSLFNKLKNSANLNYLKNLVINKFGEEYQMLIKYHSGLIGHHDREMNIGRLVRY